MPDFDVPVSNSYSIKSSVPSWLQAIPYIGSGLSFLNSLFSKDKTSDYINQQFANNVKMWNMQNAYNTPSAVKSRLEAAGFNPMFYGPDGNQAQQLSPVDVAGAATAASSKEQVRLQKEQQALQTAQNVANIELTKAEASKARAEAKVSNNSVENNIYAAKLVVDNLYSDIANKDADAIAKRIQNVLTANSLGYQGVSFQFDTDTLDNILEDNTDYYFSPKAKRAVELMSTELANRIRKSTSEINSLDAATLASKVATAVSQYDLENYKHYGVTREDGLVARLIVGILNKLGVDINFE